MRIYLLLSFCAAKILPTASTLLNVQERRGGLLRPLVSDVEYLRGSYFECL